MSWFDATGIASLAKTALKEAQKTIDKALDIKEDEDNNRQIKISSTSSSLSSRSEKNSPDSSEHSEKSHDLIKQSISSPLLSTVATNNLWESFTGSFFDVTAANGDKNKPAVTVAPTSNSESRLIQNKTDEEQNESSQTSSVSESIEMLSSPMTPSSGLTSPSANCQPSSSASCVTLQHSHKTSESIEVIKDKMSPNNELLSPCSIVSTTGDITSVSCSSISDSVEVIDGNQITNNTVTINSVDEISPQLNEDEEDSVSCNTVSESTAPVTILDKSTNPLKANQRQCLSLQLPSIPDQMTKSSSKEQLNRTIGSVSLEKSTDSFDIQTTYSDSTQSFEDVQQILSDETHKNSVKETASIDCASVSPQSTEDKQTLKAIVISEHNSGHTSADEIETTTSSDIEIISGPNGDSSSQNSVNGLATGNCKSSKLPLHSQYVVFGTNSKKKGHYRELSEASTYSLQSESDSEHEKLLHRVNELTEVIEVRECKLVELGRENAQLHEQNGELKNKLDALQLRVDSQGINTDDYTQRMSALERKFQQTLRERDSLRSEMKTIQATLIDRISKDDVDKFVEEKDVMIEELRHEGEKLSKQVLQHSNIIKKLRTKEKESDSLIKKQSEQIEELILELERSKKSLSAKEDVEKSQIQAIHKLTSEKQKLTKDLANAKSELEDTIQRFKTIQTSFEAAKKELTEKQQEHYSLTKKAKNLTSLQTEQQTLQQQNQQLTAEIESMREKFKSNSTEQTGQMQKLRQENVALIRKLEEIERRAEDQSQAITEATIPLVKQCQSLQTTLNTRTNAWEKQETAFLKKIEMLENKLTNQSLNEQSASEQSDQLVIRIQNLEESLSKALLKSEQSATCLQQKQMELELMQSDYTKKLASCKEEASKYQLQIDELNEMIKQLQQQLKESRESERITLSTEKPKLRRKISSVEFAEQMEHGNASDHSDDAELSRIVNNSSPTFSVGKMSGNESTGSNLWQLDEFDSISNVGNARPTLSNSMYGAAFSGGSALIETLQANLKRRDGECHHLQWELSQAQNERNILRTQVATLSSQIEDIKDKLATHDSVVTQLEELREQYDAILQMYGEKVEETQELQLDLQDVKDMYRLQIDDLLVQQRQLQQHLLNAQEPKKVMPNAT